MKPLFSKFPIQNQIEEFFKNVKDKSPKEIKKIKLLAMSKNIALKEKRKLFCGKCFSVYKNPKIRIRKGIKNIACENCRNIARWRL